MSPGAVRGKVSGLLAQHVPEGSCLVLLHAAAGAASGSHKERAARAVVSAAAADPVHRPIAAADLRPTSVNEPLANWCALHGQSARDAIRASRGAVLALTDAQLRGACNLGWLLDGASPSAGAGIAGYALSGHEFATMAGVHVAVLTDRTIARGHGTTESGYA